MLWLDMLMVWCFGAEFSYGLEAVLQNLELEDYGLFSCRKAVNETIVDQTKSKAFKATIRFFSGCGDAYL